MGPKWLPIYICNMFFNDRANVLYRRNHLWTKYVLSRQKKIFSDGVRVIYKGNKSFTERENAFYQWRKDHLQTFPIKKPISFVRFFGKFMVWQDLMTFKNPLATTWVQYALGLWTFLFKLAKCATYIKWLWLQSLQKCTGCKHHGFLTCTFVHIKKRSGSMR